MIRFTARTLRNADKLSTLQQKNINTQQKRLPQINIFSSKGLQFNLKSTNVKYGYFTLVDKPIQSVALNSIIQLGAQFMYFPFIEWSWPAQASIFIGAVAYRILIELLTKFIEVLMFHIQTQNLKYKNFQNRFLYKAIQKVFLVDLNRDIKFYVRISQKIERIQTTNNRLHFFVTIVLDICQKMVLLQFYLNLNFLRAAHHILVHESFNSFHLHTIIFPTLAAHDPMFMLPLIPMALTYFWIAKSQHPLLIHLRRQQNFFFRVNLAFMTGLIFVPLPTIYSLAYTGLLTGHLIVRKFYHEKQDIKQDWSTLFKSSSKQTIQMSKSDLKNTQNQKNSQRIDQDKK